MIAVDSNILVHAHRGDASLHSEARDCIRQLAESPAAWAVCFHSLVEFYGIATHPKIWDRSSTPEQASNQISAWQESPSLCVLTESPSEMQALTSLAIKAKVIGPMIHDARIASCCLEHGITELWTVDRDFSRFSKLRTKNPLL